MLFPLVRASQVYLVTTFPHTNMDNAEVQKKCEDFLRSLGVPGFIIFGWKKGAAEKGQQAEYGVVSSYHQVPKEAAIKGMTWALADFVKRSF